MHLLIRSALSTVAAASLATAPALARAVLPAQHIATPGARQHALLYVTVNNYPAASYIAVYDAYAKHPRLLRKISAGITSPMPVWTGPTGNVYAGNDTMYTSDVTVYAPGKSKPFETYTSNIDLPFGGNVDASGNLYVCSVGNFNGSIQVFPPGSMQPSESLTDNIHVPHGLAFDSHGNLFLAQIWGDSSSMLEFAHGSTTSTVLPAALPSNAFLEDLKVDAKNDLVVADAYLNTVRFFAPPYKKQTAALTAGLSAPTGLAYGPDGTLFVTNEYDGQNGNVAVFPPGATQPSEFISDGIVGGALGVAVGPER